MEDPGIKIVIWL